MQRAVELPHRGLVGLLVFPHHHLGDVSRAATEGDDLGTRCGCASGASLSASGMTVIVARSGIGRAFADPSGPSASVSQSAGLLGTRHDPDGDIPV
jgi:hypothetical protein